MKCVQKVLARPAGGRAYKGSEAAFSRLLVKTPKGPTPATATEETFVPKANEMLGHSAPMSVMRALG